MMQTKHDMRRTFLQLLLAVGKRKYYEICITTYAIMSRTEVLLCAGGKKTNLFFYNSVLKISVNRISNTVPHSLLCYMAEKTTSL